jgi:hypothetical protein
MLFAVTWSHGSDMEAGAVVQSSALGTTSAMRAYRFVHTFSTAGYTSLICFSLSCICLSSQSPDTFALIRQLCQFNVCSRGFIFTTAHFPVGASVSCQLERCRRPKWLCYHSSDRCMEVTDMKLYKSVCLGSQVQSLIS